jgi:hypothetical protein
MTLSLETLLSLPLLEFKSNKQVLQELLKSEEVNKVYKQNAGALQENVKHPTKLLTKLNNIVAPNYSALLTQLHENSEVTRLISKP